MATRAKKGGHPRGPGLVAGDHVADAAPHGVVGPEEDHPNDDAVDVAEEDRGAGHVFDALGEGMNLRADVVDNPLNGGVEEFDDQNENERCDHQRGGDGVDGQNDRERDEQNCEDEIFAERRLVLQSGEETVDGIAHRREEIQETTALDERLFGSGRRGHERILGGWNVRAEDGSWLSAKI